VRLRRAGVTLCSFEKTACRRRERASPRTGGFTF
jgi:hypothetical protein